MAGCQMSHDKSQNEATTGLLKAGRQHIMKGVPCKVPIK